MSSEGGGGASSGSGSGGGNNNPSSAVMSLPSVEFLSDVEAFMGEAENDNNAQLVLRKLEDSYSKLKLSESNNVNTKRR